MTDADLAELKERILSRCEWQDGPLQTPCLVWFGALRGGYNEYGNIRYQGMNHQTHRVIWICEYGEIEAGKEICHDCHTPRCNNILHLRCDSHASNMADASRLGRFPDRRGENQNGALLTNAQVSFIKYFLQQGWSCTLLAERYGVSAVTISHIKCEDTWAHIQPFQPIDGEPLPILPPSTTPAIRRRSL